jgi:UDP-N-acetylglucosamine 3-dehydrogenase
MRKIKVGVIGLGNMGWHHARNYSQLSSAHLTAVCDTQENLGKETAKKYRCPYYTDYREMLAHEDIEAVSIATPNNTHASIAVYCMQNKVNVLVEKPIAGSFDDAKKIVATAKEKGKILCVGHVERFNPGVQAMKRLIDRGTLGKVISILARRVGGYPPQIQDTNVVIDLAVHDIDVCSYLLGNKPNSVYCKGGYALQTSQLDYAELVISYPYTNAVLQVNWVTPVKVRMLNITGTKGYAELNYITQNLVVYESNYRREAKDYGDLVSFGEPRKHEVPLQHQEPLSEELRSFLEVVSGKETEYISGEEALDTLKVALQAVQSI